MPTYDYQCRSCGTVTEIIHSMLENGPTTCEHCGGALRRVFYPTGIIFKGSGFYSTDSRPRSSAAKGESSDGSSDGASGASGASGESSEKASSGKASEKSSSSSSDGGGSNGSRGESSSRSKKAAPSSETG